MTRLERAGLECDLARVIHGRNLPMACVTFHASFCQLPQEDLLVSGCDMDFRCKG
jgi:hypothetical protein